MMTLRLFYPIAHSLKFLLPIAFCLKISIRNNGFKLLYIFKIFGDKVVDIFVIDFAIQMNKSVSKFGHQT